MSNRTDAGQEIDLGIALNRRRVIEALRSGKHRQAIARIGRWWSPDASVCFLGVVLRVMGVPKPDFEIATHQHEGLTVAELLGIDAFYLIDYTDMNDKGASFLDLASRLEAEPPPIKNIQQQA